MLDGVVCFIGMVVGLIIGFVYGTKRTMRIIKDSFTKYLEEEAEDE